MRTGGANGRRCRFASRCGKWVECLGCRDYLTGGVLGAQLEVVLGILQPVQQLDLPASWMKSERGEGWEGRGDRKRERLPERERERERGGGGARARERERESERERVCVREREREVPACRIE